MTTFAELKEKAEEMKQAADRLLQVTKDLREAVSVPWIKGRYSRFGANHSKSSVFN